MVVWRVAKGWQAENKVSFFPKLVSFLLPLGARQWYVVGAYVPPTNRQNVHRMEQALRAAPKGLELIRMGDLNARLGNPREKLEEDLATVLADRVLVNMKEHFLPRRRYRGADVWVWSMQRDRIQITGREDYILSTDRNSFVNKGLWETCRGTYHRLILAVLRGEGALRNCRYRQGRTCWPIRTNAIRPQI